MDQKAFERKLLALSNRLYGWLLARTRDPDTAQDLLQQALARAWERRHTVSAEAMQDEQRFAGWAFAIARNIYLDGCRRESADPTVSAPSTDGWADLIAAPDGDPGKPLELADAFDALLARLREAIPGDTKAERLARFLEMGRQAGADKEQWAELMEFTGPRSVDAYLSELRRWCEANGIAKEQFIGILAALSLLGAAASARASAGAPEDAPRQPDSPDKILRSQLQQQVNECLPRFFSADWQAKYAARLQALLRGTEEDKVAGMRWLIAELDRYADRQWAQRNVRESAAVLVVREALLHKRLPDDRRDGLIRWGPRRDGARICQAFGLDRSRDCVDALWKIVVDPLADELTAIVDAFVFKNVS